MLYDVNSHASSDDDAPEKSDEIPGSAIPTIVTSIPARKIATDVMNNVCHACASIGGAAPADVSAGLSVFVAMPAIQSVLYRSVHIVPIRRWRARQRRPRKEATWNG